MPPFADRELPRDFEVEPINPRKRLPPGPGPGRPKGSVNRVVRDLKEGLITAAENIGSDGNGEGGLVGFLEDLGRHHKRAFASLLVKLLPMQISGNATLGAHIANVNILSVPTGSYLAAEDIERFKQPGHREDGSSVPESQPAPLLLEQRPEPIDLPPVQEQSPVDGGQQLLDAIEALARRVEQFVDHK